MRPLKVFVISAGALVLSFFLPGVLMLGFVRLLPKLFGNEGWSFIGYMALALMAGFWVQGMLWGVALFTPIAALVERFSRATVNGWKVLLVLLVVWTVPAGFVAWKLEPVLREFRLRRPEPSECISGIQQLEYHLDRGPTGRAALFGSLFNNGKLHLTTLEGEFKVHPGAGDTLGIDRTILCEMIQPEAWEKTPLLAPRVFGRFRCDEPDIDLATSPTVELVGFKSWGCKELGNGIFR